MVRKVEVVPFQDEWAEKFLEEKEHLIKVFAPYEVFVHHIGSTSVPGLAAKPIIDMLAESQSLEIFDQYARKLGEFGYEARGENGIPNRRYFVKFSSTGERLIHLHSYQTGDSEIQRHLVFRDYLRMHPELAAKYGAIKVEAAKRFPSDIDSYIAFKDHIVKELEAEALQWKKKSISP
jgi:GrpB-like predicted nucleotidyltransferase (UPF0157 family)